MQSIVTRKIRDVSRKWNISHDYMRVLPVELRAMCWSYLPQADVVRLARVCSSWRDLSRGIPSLWTSIEVLGSILELDNLLARSGQLPFELSVTVHSVQEHTNVDDCVRIHAHRLRALHVSDKHYSFAGATRGQDLFRYPAPMLEHFSLKLISQTNDGNFTLAPDIFLGCAPNLRSVTLDQIPFPSVCAAFSRLTMLKFRWSFGVLTSGLQQIFTVSPCLEQLELSDVSNIAGLPPASSCSTLRRMTLIADDPELWGPCLSYLDQTDRCRLLLVCSFWRERVLGLPELWATLDIRRIDISCEDLMRRSSELPLDLTVVLSSAKDVEHLDASVKAHMRRVRSFSLVIQCTDYAMTLASRTAFRYSASNLTRLSFVAHGDEAAAFRISKHMFDGDAPGLRSVLLCNVNLPSQCPAFRSATTLNLEGNTGDLTSLFDVFPTLTTLGVRDPNRRTVLPPIPAGALLRTLELGFAESSRWRMTPMQLSGNGYFYLDYFTIRIQNGVEDLLEALNLATEDGSSCALTISGRLDAELITDTEDGRTLRFSTSISTKADVGTVIGQPEFPLRDLTLPSRLLVQLPGRFKLPRQEVLTVVCAQPVPVPMLFIDAPLLHRVEFIAGTNGRGVSCCYPGTPETREAFIRRCFQIDNTGAIDVRADPADPPVQQELRADVADPPDEAHTGPADPPDDVPAGQSDSTDEALRRYVRNRLSPNTPLPPADEAVVLKALGDILTLGRVHRSKLAS